MKRITGVTALLVALLMLAASPWSSPIYALGASVLTVSGSILLWTDKSISLAAGEEPEWARIIGIFLILVAAAGIYTLISSITASERGMSLAPGAKVGGYICAICVILYVAKDLLILFLRDGRDPPGSSEG